MKAKDHGRMYWCSVCGGKQHFETEGGVRNHCTEEHSVVHPAAGVDYHFFSDHEQDKNEQGYAKEADS